MEHEISLAHVGKVGIQDLDKQMDGLEVHELIVVHVDTHGKVQARVSLVHNLGIVPEFDEIAL